MKNTKGVVMTLSQFEDLDYINRLQVATSAVCIAGREEGFSKVLLFQVNSFYVEVYYDKHKHFISQVSGFDDTACLEPYLSKISIGELIET